MVHRNSKELLASRRPQRGQSARQLSPRQQKMLEFIKRFVVEHGYPPTIREIGLATGISSTSVVDYNLSALERMGYLRRDPEISRGIELMGNRLARSEEAKPLRQNRLGENRPGIVRVPVVGRIAAGEPIEAVAGADETIDLSDSIAPENAYVLRVKGKSMIDDLIDDGDLVVVEPRSTADNGDIVVALLTDGPTGEGQATLKRIYREKGLVRLQPANATMEPIFVKPENLLIQGRVVSVIRRVRHGSAR